MTDASAGPQSDATTPPSAPDPAARLVYGTAAVDDLDGFLADCDAVAAETGAVVQAFDAGLVASETHLREAARLAARSIARDEAVARDPGVEILLYAAGRRQIDRAFELGVETGDRGVVVLLADFGDVPGSGRPAADLDRAVEATAPLVVAGPADDPASTDGTGAVDEERLREFHGISDRELDATSADLSDVVRERVALLDVEK